MTCKRCGSRNSVVKDAWELKCLMCGEVNETLPGYSNAGEILSGLAEELLDATLNQRVAKATTYGRHSHSPAFGGATSETTEEVRWR